MAFQHDRTSEGINHRRAEAEAVVAPLIDFGLPGLIRESNSETGARTDVVVEHERSTEDSLRVALVPLRRGAALPVLVVVSFTAQGRLQLLHDAPPDEQAETRT